MSEDDSCFKVPKSIARSKAVANDHPNSLKHDGLSSQYLGMIMTKQKQQRKDTLMNCTPQFGTLDESSNDQSVTDINPRTSKRYVRGPYKKKRHLKFESKLMD